MARNAGDLDIEIIRELYDMVGLPLIDLFRMSLVLRERSGAHD